MKTNYFTVCNCKVLPNIMCFCNLLSGCSRSASLNIFDSQHRPALEIRPNTQKKKMQIMISGHKCPSVLQKLLILSYSVLFRATCYSEQLGILSNSQLRQLSNSAYPDSECISKNCCNVKFLILWFSNPHNVWIGSKDWQPKNQIEMQSCHCKPTKTSKNVV